MLILVDKDGGINLGASVPGSSVAIFEEGRESRMSADLWTLSLNACF